VLALLAVFWAIVVCLDLSTDDDPMCCPPYAAEEYRKQQEAKEHNSTEWVRGPAMMKPREL